MGSARASIGYTLALTPPGTTHVSNTWPIAAQSACTRQFRPTAWHRRTAQAIKQFAWIWLQQCYIFVIPKNTRPPMRGAFLQKRQNVCGVVGWDKCRVRLLFELLLQAQVCGVTALLLAAVSGARVEAGVAPEERAMKKHKQATFSKRLQ